MPSIPVPHAFGVAVKHHQAGRLSEAEALYRQILEVQPEHAEALHLWGVIAHQGGQEELAVSRIRQALLLKPAFVDAYSNLGVAYHALGKFDEAIAACRRAIELRPDLAEAHYNLGNVLKDGGQIAGAMDSFRNALKFRPDYADAENNLGNCLREAGRLDEALSAYGRALELRPDYSKGHNNTGLALVAQGRLDEGIAAFGEALQIKPDDAEVHSNLICAWQFHPKGGGVLSGEKQRWNRRFGGSLQPVMLSCANDRDPERRLRVGYVSPNFGDHVVGRNLLPLFRGHDPRNFEIVCYSGGLSSDKLTEEFRRVARQWRSAVGLADEAVAKIIHEDGVDILVDLTQHLAGNRLPVFARKPAPVQVSFAGYPESTGLEAIEYRISDRWLEAEEEIRSAECGAGNAECGWKPEGETASPNSEFQPAERVFLIDSFWCYDPCGMEMAVHELPATETGWLTFGSLNNFCKINEPVLRLWARVLAQVKGSRLLLLSGFGSHRECATAFLEGEGIERDRIEFVAPGPRKEYLELYHRVDIALDPFPYGGHTTSLDALWMGVPVVSLAGERAVSRGGLSILNNLGLPELVAFSEEEYVRIATELAGDLSRVAELRRTLRARMEGSVLMDGPRFARNIEAAYRAMWRRWCAGDRAGRG